MDRRSRPGPEPTTLEAVGDQWRYALIVVQAGIDDDDDDGGNGDNWSKKRCKAPVKSSPPTNQHPTFYRPDALAVAQPTLLQL